MAKTSKAMRMMPKVAKHAIMVAAESATTKTTRLIKTNQSPKRRTRLGTGMTPRIVHIVVEAIEVLVEVAVVTEVPIEVAVVTVAATEVAVVTEVSIEATVAVIEVTVVTVVAIEAAVVTVVSTDVVVATEEVAVETVAVATEVVVAIVATEVTEVDEAEEEVKDDSTMTSMYIQASAPEIS